MPSSPCLIFQVAVDLFADLHASCLIYPPPHELPYCPSTFALGAYESAGSLPVFAASCAARTKRNATRERTTVLLLL